MDSLQNAEKELENLQKQLEQAKQAQEHVVTEKEILEKQLQETHADSGSLHTSYSDLEISQLKAEIEVKKRVKILIHTLTLFFKNSCCELNFKLLKVN